MNGVLDVALALTWVQKYIHAFGTYVCMSGGPDRHVKVKDE